MRTIPYAGMIRNFDPTLARPGVLGHTILLVIDSSRHIIRPF